MAALSVSNRHPKRSLYEWLRTWLVRCRKMLDGFVGERLRHSAMQARSIRSRRWQDDGRHAQPSGHANIPPVAFEPLAPDVLSETIPAFFIGRNRAGLWVAREAKGRVGGIFLLKSSAMNFAWAASREGCAMIFPSQRFELDLENRGSALAAFLTSLMRTEPAYHQPPRR